MQTLQPSERRRALQRILGTKDDGIIQIDPPGDTFRAFLALAGLPDIPVGNKPAPSPAPTVRIDRPLSKIVEVAERYLGVREVTKNRSPEIATFWDFTSYREGDENREPWCCAAVVAWIQMADKETAAFNLAVPPKTASCAEFLAWSKRPANRCLTFGPDSREHRPQAGDIVIFLPRLSHIGIVARDYDGRGQVHTIEGNTDDGGSREGDGVYRRQRAHDFCGTFIRLPAA